MSEAVPVLFLNKEENLTISEERWKQDKTLCKTVIAHNTVDAKERDF